jgi:porin
VVVCGGNEARLVALSLLLAASVMFAAPYAQAEDKPKSIWEQETLTGDWGGARTALKEKAGIEIKFEYTNEVFAVMSGGVRRESSYEGQVHLSVNTDLEKLIGWTGGKAHVTVLQIHDSGRNVAENSGSIFDPSNLDALPTTRLYTAYFEQSFANKVLLRIGQIVGDGEFFTSDTAGGLINGTFGWASIFGANMRSGGPAYPLATPGVRVQVNASEEITALAAVFSGDPAGCNCNDNPQACNRYGTTFSFSGGALGIGEVQYAVNQDKKAAGLPGVYKLGAWYATADYADQRYGLDAAGAIVSLASPAATGPLNHRGNWGIYGVADQMVWRNGASSLNLFVRSGTSPSDRNLLSYYVDTGAGFKGLIPGRADDVLTFGAAYAGISRDAAALDRDTLAINGPPYPIRDYEFLFEVSYQAQIAPWWIVQPDLQYIVHPGGHVPDPNNPNAAIGNAFIAGIRSTIKF